MTCSREKQPGSFCFEPQLPLSGPVSLCRAAQGWVSSLGLSPRLLVNWLRGPGPDTVCVPLAPSSSTSESGLELSWQMGCPGFQWPDRCFLLQGCCRREEWLWDLQESPFGLCGPSTSHTLAFLLRAGPWATWGFLRRLSVYVGE